MEQIARNELAASGRRNHDLDHQIHSRQLVKPSPSPSPRHRRSASTHTNDTFSESIFSNSPSTSYESLTSNSVNEHTSSDLRQEISHDRRKAITELRRVSNTCRRDEEIKGPSRRCRGIIVNNRSVSHKGHFAGHKSRREKAIIDHGKDEKHAEEVHVIPRDHYGKSGDRYVHPIYTGVYPHRSEPGSIKGREHLSQSLSASTQSRLIDSNDIERTRDKYMVPVLTYAQTNTGRVEKSSATLTDGITRTAEWLRNLDHQVPALVTQATPAEGIHDKKASADHRIKEEVSDWCNKFTSSRQKIRTFKPFDSNHKATPCSEISLEPVPTGMVNRSAEASSVPENPPFQEIPRQLTLPFRIKQSTAIHSVDHRAQSIRGTLPAIDVACSQTTQESISLGSQQNDENSPNKTRKRKSWRGNSSDEPGEDSNGSDDGDDGDKRTNRRQRGKNHKGKEAVLPALACPYFKYDPSKYAGKDWRNCCGPGWPSVHRMKEHLYKRHRQPKFVCERCGSPFQDEENLKDHLRQIRPCVLQELRPMDGFDSKQESKLRSRKRAVTELSEIEKWKQTYKILFPHIQEDQIPSPFYEYVESNFSILKDYEEYAPGEIQGGLRNILEQEFEDNLGITGADSKQRAVEIFERMHSRLLQKFRNACERGIQTPTTPTTPTTSTSASVVILQDRSETRPPSELPSPLSADQPFFNGCYNPIHFSSTLGIAQDFDFSFDPYTDANVGPLLEVMVESFSNDGASKPSDSAYGSMSIKGSSECSRDPAK